MNESNEQVNFSNNSYKAGSTKEYCINDTIPKFIKLSNDEIENFDLYLNGEKTNAQILKSISPNNIKKFSIGKEKKELKIITNNNYKPHTISIKKLIDKYITNSYPSIYCIDSKILDRSTDKFVVDKKYIMKIEHKIIETSNNNKLNYINLVTRTTKNIEKANTIYIRGESIGLVK
jgi:hypothetical protein